MIKKIIDCYAEALCAIAAAVQALDDANNPLPDVRKRLLNDAVLLHETMGWVLQTPLRFWIPESDD